MAGRAGTRIEERTEPLVGGKQFAEEGLAVRGRVPDLRNARSTGSGLRAPERPIGIESTDFDHCAAQPGITRHLALEGEPKALGIGRYGHASQPLSTDRFAVG